MIRFEHWGNGDPAVAKEQDFSSSGFRENEMISWQAFCIFFKKDWFKNVHPAMMLKKIIIIDDEKDFCQLLENYFIKKNYAVETYYLLHDGLKALENHQQGIVFLDNNLPDGLGWQKIEELHDMYPNLKLHLLSGFNYMSKAIPKNAQVKFWQKPISFNDLDKYFK